MTVWKSTNEDTMVTALHVWNIEVSIFEQLLVYFQAYNSVSDCF